MRIYKKIAALALSGVMTLGLMAGCSTTETETTPTTAPTVNQATSPTGSEGASEAQWAERPHYRHLPGGGFRNPGGICGDYGRGGRR